MKNILIAFIASVLFSTSIIAQNNSLDFDGTNDYVNCSNDISFNPGTGSFTIEAWIKPTALTGSHRFIWRNDGTTPPFNGYYLMITDTAVAAEISDNSNSAYVSGGTLIAGAWHHVALVRDASGGTVILYLDGVRVNSTADNTGNISYSGNLELGGRSDYVTEMFSGLIDEVRYWNDARTLTEIRANMYRELTSPASEPNLVAYYKFNEASGTTADNAEGTAALDGTLTNMTDADWVTSSAFAGPKYALDFDGTDDYVDCGNGASLTGMTKLTIEAWVKPAVADVHRVVLSNYNSSSSGGYQLSINNSGTFTLGIRNQSLLDRDVNGTTVRSAGKWYHIAGTMDWDGSQTTLKIYVNGILEATAIYTGADNQISYSNLSNLFIGTNIDGVPPGGATNVREFSGLIEEVRIWNVLRTAVQIRDDMCEALTGNETGLAAYYNFDNNSGTKLQDFSGNGNDGTLTNMDAGTDWVSSSAFNTWLNVTNSTWSTTTNWSRGSAPGSTDNVGITNYTGGTNSTLSGSPTVDNLVLKASSTLTLNSGLTVNGNLILENNLALNGQTVTLGSAATLVESTGKLTGGSNGKIQTTRTLDGSSTQINENVAGLGANITTSANMGSTTIVRGHEAKDTKAINRYYQITPTNNSGLNATLVINYEDSELNGQTESTLELYKSTDGSAGSWSEQSASTVNTTNNTLTLTGISSFSWWTGGAPSGLPVELTSFSAISIDDGVLLNWETATEVNNYGFEIERASFREDGTTPVRTNVDEGTQSSVSMTEWKKIGFVEGHGNSNSPKKYSFIDTDFLTAERSLSYRLKQIDTDGSFEYSEIIEVEIELPTKFELSQNYPNPFNPSTTINYRLPFKSKVRVEIFSMLGQRVKMVTNGIKDAGIHSTLWNASNLASGIYVIRINASSISRKGNFSKSIKTLLLR